MSTGALNNEAQDREVRILGDYVYDFFMTLIIICTGETAVIVVLSAIAISNIAVVYSPFLIAFVITALYVVFERKHNHDENSNTNARTQVSSYSTNSILPVFTHFYYGDYDHSTLHCTTRRSL